MSETQKEILDLLIKNDIKLVYGIGNFPVSISFNGTINNIEIDVFDEIKHISFETYTNYCKCQN